MELANSSFRDEQTLNHRVALVANTAAGMTQRVMFLYWGRRGLSRFVYEVAEAALTADPETSVSVSRQIESFAGFGRFGSRLFAVDTFANDIGAISRSWKLPMIHRALIKRLRDEKIDTVIELMPHVWSTLILSRVRRAGIRYATLIHDAEAHPGDRRTSSVSRILSSAAKNADVVLTLSETVTAGLERKYSHIHGRVHTLFHPDLNFAPPSPRQPRERGEPLRLLWLGRVLPYKGLPLFVHAVELLRQKNANIDVGVFGDGDLGDLALRLAGLNCEVVNRWLSEMEIAEILRRHDLMVMSHIESSQSGIAATAFGGGLPAICTPVGGLVEQIDHQVTGSIASDVTAPALADAIMRLSEDRQLYEQLVRNVEERRSSRSVERFVADCIASVRR